MSKTNHSFFIPESIRRFKLAEMPQSKALAASLRKLKLVTLGDLSGISLRDFTRVSDNGRALVLEICELIANVRRGDFGAPPPENPRSRIVLPARRQDPEAELKIAEDRENGALPASAPAPGDTIFIPSEARGRMLEGLSMSVRLRHVLQFQDCRLFGDLHGRSFSKIAEYRNCGKKTVEELKNLVREIQRSHYASSAEDSIGVQIRENRPSLNGGEFFVSAKVQNVEIRDLPVSVRLAGVLRRGGVKRLGDVHGLTMVELRRIKNCGRGTLSELARLIDRAVVGEFDAPGNFVWDPAELMRILNGQIADLPKRSREVLLLRLGAQTKEVPTLETLGEKFGLTRERVRQIVKLAVERIKRLGGRHLRWCIEHLKEESYVSVCPLIPELVAEWLGSRNGTATYNAAFYLRLLIWLDPNLPVWPNGKDQSGSQIRRSPKIEALLKTALLKEFQAIPLKVAFQQVRENAGRAKPNQTEFLAALEHSVCFDVIFPESKTPVVKLARRSTVEIARAVLAASQKPLTPEEIVADAETIVGSASLKINPRTVGNALTEEKGFFLLGPRSYGLRQHFQLPEQQWRHIQEDFSSLLKNQNRPISSTEVVNLRCFAWSEGTNAYELACILRADDRIIDLGKFLFALKQWGLEEREKIKDLIPKVLTNAGTPLTGTEVFARLQQLRSASPTSIASTLRKHPEVRDYGFGHYGLKSWGDSVKGSIVGNAELVQRIIRRATPPLTFGRLAEILEVPSPSDLLKKLWDTCTRLPQVLRIPDENSPNTRLIHRACRLERALVATARRVNRALPLFEIQWELNERFGELFLGKSLDEIRRTLQQSQMFVRNANEEFILDVNLDQLGLDAGAIRSGCAEILSECKEIVGCEDLLDRLEA